MLGWGDGDPWPIAREQVVARGIVAEPGGIDGHGPAARVAGGSQTGGGAKGQFPLESPYVLGDADLGSLGDGSLLGEVVEAAQERGGGEHDRRVDHPSGHGVLPRASARTSMEEIGGVG
ncbi:hypothetical protein J4558_25490 [Leptolyngbya sp. 15MV]|nr:hypothetical protein J4558_25490 [Leptolyngbya sp. 15MV]